jgi:hypothetical protein
MDNKLYQMDTFVELPKIIRASTLSSCFVASQSAQDLYLDSTSFDDSYMQRSSSLKRNTCIKSFDSSSDLNVDYENYSDVKSSRVSFEHQTDSKSQNSEEIKEKKHGRYKSLLSMIKILKKFSVKENSKKANCETSKSILRRPREYMFVKGMSGLSIRVEKVPSASSQAYCHRCYTRNG